MLCLTCPLRPTCKKMCDELTRDLSKIEGLQIESPKPPEKIEAIELQKALQAEFRPLEIEAENEAKKFDAEKLENSLESLTKRQRECLHLFYWQGLSHKKIAEALGIRRQTVSQHLEAAVLALRAHYLPSAHIGEKV